jgi:hypothetical protein
VCGSCGTFLDAAHIKEFPQRSAAQRIARMDRWNATANLTDGKSVRAQALE